MTNRLNEGEKDMIGYALYSEWEDLYKEAHDFIEGSIAWERRFESKENLDVFESAVKKLGFGENLAKWHEDKGQEIAEAEAAKAHDRYHNW